MTCAGVTCRRFAKSGVQVPCLRKAQGLLIVHWLIRKSVVCPYVRVSRAGWRSGGRAWRVPTMQADAHQQDLDVLGVVG